ncbi:MAG: 5-oxoprolinase subunit PxpB [Saccharospirillum sp.]|nr:5-oxoprolinase subunit PxpB [Saccharospirillum sp.]
MKLDVVSENAILVELGDAICESLIPRMVAVEHAIEQALGEVLVDLIPSYTTLLCVYDLNKVDYQWMLKALTKVLDQIESQPALSAEGKRVEIPVWYDPEVGYDLERLADQKNLSIEVLINKHSGKDYQVFALGFSPGFAFLGRVDESIAAPRHSSPRSAVAPGSVGIADFQTAIYPIESPGGWNIVGRSPQRMFDPDRGDHQAALLQVGDRVRFKPIERSTFVELGGHLE